ncbi:MAG: LysR family transcriptional regulator [Marinicaulis sp.]|nr:LysR family transcriptional regulator [Marinicaulis sp.]
MMDLAEIRTFLAVLEGGSFVAAARLSNVTQSTVSARIKSLETRLGVRLFIRTKARCDLTPAGSQFYRYARSLARVWEEAKHQVAIPEGFTDTLIVGGQYSMWNRLLLQWVGMFRAAQPNVALRCEVGMPQRLLREMREGVMDIAVVYQPEYRPGFEVEELFEDELILVAAMTASPLEESYVHIDWGPDFREKHAAAFPNLPPPAVTLDLGALGVNYVLGADASAYFPRRIVAPFISAGRLHEIEGAPRYGYPAYAVYQEEFAAPIVMAVALDTLRETAHKAANDELPPPFWR